MQDFKDWQEIKKWAEEHKFLSLAKKLQFNNDNWMSCGEFGRNQVFLCDTLRFAKDEADRLEKAERLEELCAEDLW